MLELVKLWIHGECLLLQELTHNILTLLMILVILTFEDTCQVLHGPLLDLLLVLHLDLFYVSKFLLMLLLGQLSS